VSCQNNHTLIAGAKLDECLQEMAPFTFQATDRIKQFGDHVGVTDRYTGYRHNLTRTSQDPTKMQQSWMDPGKVTGFMNPTQRSYTSMFRD
jgi:hypothetical protein